MMKRIVCVYLGDWPIQRLVVARPELKRQRIVLYSRDSRGQRVSAISPAARRDRVRLGMPLSEARAILKEIPSQPRLPRAMLEKGRGDQCAAPLKARGGASQIVRSQAGAWEREIPSSLSTLNSQLSTFNSSLSTLNSQLSTFNSSLSTLDSRLSTLDSQHFFPHDPDADRVALAELALSCESLAPRVGLEPGPHPESIFLDVTGVAHLFGGESGLLRHIQRHFDDRGYTARAVLADTIGAAWGLAKFGGETDFARLPLEALRLAPATCETLRQLGVDRIEQVGRLPRTDLWSRFGDEIHRRLDQASGAQEEVLDWLPPPIEWYAQRFLDFPTTDAATIRFIASQLIEEICGQLRAGQRGGLRWECRLYSPETAPLRIEMNLFQPAAAVGQVAPLLQMHLEQLGLATTQPSSTRRQRQDFDAPFCVHHISVSVSHSAVLVDRQRRLFDEDPRLNRQDLAHLINRLSARLGAPRVLGPRWLAEAQPELACHFEPLVGAAPSRSGNRPELRAAAPLRRPLRLHAPLPIDVLSAADGSPLRVTCGAGPSRVANGWGPERIETGWWRGPMVRRDYWRVELEDGRWLWLFRDLLSEQWFCQGEF